MDTPPTPRPRVIVVGVNGSPSSRNPPCPKSSFTTRRQAICVVLGAKGTNTLGARFGSTAHAVLHHTQGNVVVPRPRTVQINAACPGHFPDYAR